MKNHRGRPKSFASEEVLSAVMSVFWAKGFAATTYGALEAKTGLGRQSLVYAFGDKRAMFLQALDHYADVRVDGVIRALKEAPSGQAGLVNLLDNWARDAGRRVRRGCLLVNTAGEFGGADKDVAARVAAAKEDLTAAISSALRRAQREGTLRAEGDADALAAAVVCTGDGALLHARLNGGAADAVRALDGLRRLLFG